MAEDEDETGLEITVLVPKQWNCLWTVEQQCSGVEDSTEWEVRIQPVPSRLRGLCRRGGRRTVRARGGS